ncbi:MAG: helix-turn-helix domain-containing protein [Clostridia bacterium]
MTNKAKTLEEQIIARKEIRQNRTKAFFIAATEELIKTDGLEHTTIRKIAEKSGYGSATIYSYFDDVDELIMFASFGFRRDYLKEVSVRITSNMNALEQYASIYRIFNSYVFKQPDIFMNLYFGKHTHKLKQIVKDYYAIFPDEFVKQTDLITELILQGNLFECDIVATTRLAAEGFIKEENIKIVADILVRVHESYMQELCVNPGKDVDVINDEFMKIFYHIIETN